MATTIVENSYSPDDDEKSGKKGEEKRKSDILATARKRFKLAAESESELRTDALDDLKFSIGEQWPQEIKNQRFQDNRPCLVINRLPQFIRQITNEQRQNRPSIKVSPVDDAATPETAKIMQGMIRHIEQASNADVAYDTAFEFAVRTGRGWWRVITDYANEETFDQEIKLKRITNPFTVYADPCAREPDGSDMQWCIIVEDLAKDDYEQQYPDSELASLSDFTSIGDQAIDWLPGNMVRVAEYFYIDLKPQVLHLLSHGTVVKDEHMPKDEAGNPDLSQIDGLPEDTRIKATRTAQVPVVKWCKINGVEILEEREWAGSWIPLIPVYGEELDVNGQLHVSGIVKNAKDSQRMYNYWASAETEAIALAPKAPWIGAEGQFEGHEAEWRTANLKSHPYLEYKPTTIQGQPAPPPQRNTFEPAVQAITQARGLASDDLKATTGIYDAALGNRSNEQSGVAIQRRNQQSQTSNFHFLDNLTRSMRHTGRILLELIPQIYDTARAVRVLHPDGQEEVVQINTIFQQAGKSVKYDMGTGQYDVVMETGPSYATKRAEAVASMLDLIRSVPGVMQAAGDLLIKNMDWPGADEISERLKRALPPAFQDPGKDQQPIPPQAQAQLAQQNQMIQQLQMALQEATQKINSKALELAAKERMNIRDNQVKAEIALAATRADAGIALLEQQIEATKHGLDIAHSAATQDAQMQHDAAQAQFDRTHSMQQLGFEHAHDADQAARQRALDAEAARRAYLLKFQPNAGSNGAMAGGSATGGESPGTTMEPNS